MPACCRGTRRRIPAASLGGAFGRRLRRRPSAVRPSAARAALGGSTFGGSTLRRRLAAGRLRRLDAAASAARRRPSAVPPSPAQTFGGSAVGGYGRRDRGRRRRAIVRCACVIGVGGVGAALPFAHPPGLQLRHRRAAHLDRPLQVLQRLLELGDAALRFAQLRVARRLVSAAAGALALPASLDTRN